LEVEGSTQRGRHRKTWKEVVDNDKSDLYVNLCNPKDRNKWRKMNRGNWRDTNSDSGAVR